MYLHLGGDVVIPLHEVIAILDIKEENGNSTCDTILHIAQEEGFMVELTDKPYSCVITDRNVYLSPISSMTLKNRARNTFKV